ncbi:MAG TPA: hypothetical protein VGI79_00810 [Caulobacteraceae bacterium]|jgi:hypothetical protein
MYAIYSGDVLIGYSALEYGDPPMGVAFGAFEPTPQFSQLGAQAVLAADGAGRPVPDIRFWQGLSAKTPTGEELGSQAIVVTEYGPAGSPLGLEVSCLGIPYPLYDNLFPEHVEAYRNAFC